MPYNNRQERRLATWAPRGRFTPSPEISLSAGLLLGTLAADRADGIDCAVSGADTDEPNPRSGIRQGIPKLPRRHAVEPRRSSRGRSLGRSQVSLERQRRADAGAVTEWLRRLADDDARREDARQATWS